MDVNEIDWQQLLSFDVGEFLEWESPSLSSAIHAKRASAIGIPKALSFTAIAFVIAADIILTCMMEPAMRASPRAGPA
jgi:hypothetical protein